MTIHLPHFDQADDGDVTSKICTSGHCDGINSVWRAFTVAMFVSEAQTYNDAKDSRSTSLGGVGCTGARMA